PKWIKQICRSRVRSGHPKQGPSSGTCRPAGPANRYFSTVFSSSPAGSTNDAKQADLYTMLNKQSSRGQNGNGVTGSSGWQIPRPPTYKDGKHAYPNESSESPYFVSSMHYGGREFYSNTLEWSITQQTDSRKTMTFCFPITGVIMQPAGMPQRGGSMWMRTAYPSAVILS
ncbi:hypothetical protein ACJX0J_024739, partial [Zea mays]